MIERTTTVTETEVRYEQVEMESLLDDGCPNFRDDD